MSQERVEILEHDLEECEGQLARCHEAILELTGVLARAIDGWRCGHPSESPGWDACVDVHDKHCPGGFELGDPPLKPQNPPSSITCSSSPCLTAVGSVTPFGVAQVLGSRGAVWRGRVPSRDNVRGVAMTKDHCPWCFNRVRHSSKPKCWYCDGVSEPYDTYWVDGSRIGGGKVKAKEYGERLDKAWEAVAGKMDAMYGVPIVDPGVAERDRDAYNAYAKWRKGMSCMAPDFGPGAFFGRHTIRPTPVKGGDAVSNSDLDEVWRDLEMAQGEIRELVEALEGVRGCLYCRDGEFEPEYLDAVAVLKKHGEPK